MSASQMLWACLVKTTPVGFLALGAYIRVLGEESPRPFDDMLDTQFV